MADEAFRAGWVSRESSGELVRAICTRAAADHRRVLARAHVAVAATELIRAVLCAGVDRGGGRAPDGLSSGGFVAGGVEASAAPRVKRVISIIACRERWPEGTVGAHPGHRYTALRSGNGRGQGAQASMTSGQAAQADWWTDGSGRAGLPRARGASGLCFAKLLFWGYRAWCIGVRLPFSILHDCFQPWCVACVVIVMCYG